MLMKRLINKISQDIYGNGAKIIKSANYKKEAVSLLAGMMLLSGAGCNGGGSVIEPITNQNITEVLFQAKQTLPEINLPKYRNYVYERDNSFQPKVVVALKSLQDNFNDYYKKQFNKNFKEQCTFVKNGFYYKSDGDVSPDPHYDKDLERKRLSLVKIDTEGGFGVSVNLLYTKRNINNAFVDVYYLEDGFGAYVNPYYDDGYKYNGFITYMESEKYLFQIIYNFKNETVYIQKLERMTESEFDKEIGKITNDVKYKTDILAVR